MADTTFVSKITVIATAWLNQVNKLAFWGRRPNFATTTGSANAQILTLETGSLYTTEADGDVFWFKAGFTTTGAATLQVIPPSGTNTARALQFEQTALNGGEIVAGSIYGVARLGTTWQLLNPSKQPGATANIASVAGTNTITGSIPANETAYVTNRLYTMVPLNDSTGAATVNLTPVGGAALGAKNVFWNGAALTGGEFQALVPVTLLYDSVQFNIVGNGSAIPVGLVNAKGDLLPGTAADAVGRLAVGTDGQALSADSSQTTNLIYIDNPSRPNLLGNSYWLLDQINEGALYTVNTTDVRGPDFWSGDAVGTGVFKLRTLADPDSAPRKCLEVSCTTADAAIAAADRYEIWTAVEGYDMTEFLIGTSGAKAAMVQFKLKSNAVTGVLGVYFCNSAGNRFYAGTITIADTAEHEYSVPVPTFDLTGTWLYTNGIGLRMGLVLAAGSNFQGTAGAWTASTVKTTSAQANFMSANTNILYLKPIQLIPGALVQAYKPADIQREVAKAQRQYFKTYDQGTAIAAITGNGQRAGSADAGSFVYFSNTSFPTQRAVPTITIYSPATGAAGNIRNNSTAADVAAAGSSVGMTGMVIAVALAAPAQVGIAHFTASSRLS